MKRTLLFIFSFLLAAKSYAQQKSDSAVNTIVKELNEDWIDHETKKVLGQMRNVYLIDTLKKELRNVTLQLSSEKVTLEMYYFKNNRLEQVVEAEVIDNKTLIKDWFNFTDTEYLLDSKKVQELSAVNRKYKYLSKANDYLTILNKQF